MSALVLGSTGLVGNEILQQLNKASFFNKIVTVSRRAPKLTDPKLTAIIEENSSKWYDVIEAQKDLTYGFSAFGTTRGAAKSAENFVKIDHGINFESAKAAKAAGVETYVLISSTGADSNSSFLYMKTKGQLENDIIGLKFPRTIILRPGVLLGERDTEKGLGNKVAATVGTWLYNAKLSLGVNPVKGSEVAAVAIDAAQKPFTKGDKPQVDIINASEVSLLAKSLKV